MRSLKFTSLCVMGSDSLIWKDIEMFKKADKGHYFMRKMLSYQDRGIEIILKQYKMICGSRLCTDSFIFTKNNNVTTMLPQCYERNRIVTFSSARRVESAPRSNRYSTSLR